jgi:hypothetical protein
MYIYTIKTKMAVINDISGTFTCRSEVCRNIDSSIYYSPRIYFEEFEDDIEKRILSNTALFLIYF